MVGNSRLTMVGNASVANRFLDILISGRRMSADYHEEFRVVDDWKVICNSGE